MGTLITNNRPASATADDGIYVDTTLQITVPPLPILATPAPLVTTWQSLGLTVSSPGPILLAGGSIITASGRISPPIIVAGSGISPELTLSDAPLIVAIGGMAQQGQTLTATATGNVSAYQWQELIGGTWINLGGATNSTYVVQQADIGRQLRVEVTGAANVAAISNPTNAVRDFSGDQYVYESADQTAIGSGLFQFVYGTATNTTIDTGGEQNIYSGGVASRTMVNAGGFQIDWGNASGTGIYGGSQIVWGTATDTTVFTGRQIVMSGGAADGTEIDPNGEQTVLDGATARNTFVGGTQSVYGTSDSTTVSFGGLQQVHGLATNTTVRFNSQQNVYADGTATNTTLYDGSVQIDWGIATNTIVGRNSAQYVWGVAVNTTLSRDFFGAGEQYVETGGSAHDTQVGAYSTQYVHGGGTSSGTVVGFFGNQVVYGTDADATIFGGTQDVWGIATDATIISNLGVQNVHAGGYARNTTIDGLASAHVFAGGAVENVTFGGRFAGLILDEGSSFTGSISGWQPFAAIDLRGIQFAEGTTTLAYASNSHDSGGILTVSDGAHAITLSMLGQYTAADFAITSDGHGGTSVYDPVFLPAITLTLSAA